MAKKRMRKVSLGFIDLGDDNFPQQGKEYKLVPANGTEVGNLPYPDSNLYLIRIQVVNFYVEDLPDFTQKNEALIKFTSKTRDPKSVDNKENLTFSLEFNVTDRSYAPGFLERIIFRNLLMREYLELGFNLIELDRQSVETYGKVATIVRDSGLDKIDALNSIPYLKVATRLFDGTIRTFGKDSDDLVWSEAPSLYLKPGPGGSFLRSGIYVIYETNSLYRNKTGRQKKKPGRKMPIGKLYYKDGELKHQGDPDHPLSNHLIFSINLEAASHLSV